MLRLLIVDDEPQKKLVIGRVVLGQPGITSSNVLYADNVRDAKRLVSRYKFDLVVLDINIPRAVDRPTESGAGIDLLRFIRNSPSAIPPTYIFGLTAYDDGYSSAADEFTSALWKLARFSFSDNTWEKSLTSAVAYLVAFDRPPFGNDGATHHVDVGVVAALDEELSALLGLPLGWETIDVPHDQSRYHRCMIESSTGTVSVVATAAPRMGIAPMAVVASKMISAFHPKAIAAIGICAGVRGKVDIGDILVADPCFDWGGGKWAKEPGELSKFIPAAYQWRSDPAVLAMARQIGDDVKVLRRIYDDYTSIKPQIAPKLFIDAMACGASVLQIEDMISDIRLQHKNVLGVEMESYGVFTAAEYGTSPRPTAIVVKSVCDFGDSTKNDKFRGFACHASSCFLLELLRNPKFGKDILDHRVILDEDDGALPKTV